ncbi:MAG TPA: response regulator, partial [bacterium]|nr:response regulator [bacterium]
EWLLLDGKWVDLVEYIREKMDVPIIVMTDYENKHLAIEATKAGVLDYVVKSEQMLSCMPYIVERALREWDHITKRTQAENALRESQRLLQNVFEAIQDGIIILDREYTIVQVNQFSIKE